LSYPHTCAGIPLSARKGDHERAAFSLAASTSLRGEGGGGALFQSLNKALNREGHVVWVSGAVRAPVANEKEEGGGPDHAQPHRITLEAVIMWKDAAGMRDHRSCQGGRRAREKGYRGQKNAWEYENDGLV